MVPDHKRAMLALLTLIVLITLALSAAVFILLVRLEEDTQHDTRSQRVTAYRLCGRQMQERAALIIHIDRHIGEVLPLFNCKPDLVGKPARRLSTSEQHTFLTRFDHRIVQAP